jgi:hypothetical protein
MSPEELRAAVLQLSPDEFAHFADWFENYIADQCDQRIESDITAGRFDAAGRTADGEFEAGRCTAL